MIDRPAHAPACPLPKGANTRPPLPLGEGWGEGAAATRARALRRTATPAERKLWQALRDRAVAGAKVRRQVPCGPYVLDFLFAAQRLAIEIDGDTHALPERAAAEARRSAWLSSYGLRILGGGRGEGAAAAP